MMCLPKQVYENIDAVLVGKSGANDCSIHWPEVRRESAGFGSDDSPSKRKREEASCSLPMSVIVLHCNVVL